MESASAPSPAAAHASGPPSSDDDEKQPPASGAAGALETGGGSEGRYVTLRSAEGIEERVRVVQSSELSVLPWSFGVDVPRAIMSFIIAGVSYLL